VTRRWIWWALAAYAFVAGMILLLPVTYAGIVAWVLVWLREDLGLTGFGGGWVEFAANVLMFLPLGFLLTLLLRHHWYGVALALVLSAGAELAQFLIPSRLPSLRDVLANTLGAAIGAALAWIIVLRRERRERQTDADI